MASKAISAAFFLLLILVANSGGATGLCETPSQTWSGYCLITQDCDNQCQQWEGAAHGACKWRGITQACFCYYPHCPSSDMRAKFMAAFEKAHPAPTAAPPNPPPPHKN